jgi:hypothetical protein
MNFYITILAEFIAGLLVNMVTAFAKKKIARKKINPFNDSRLISHLEEKSSFRLSNNSLLPYLAFDNFYVNANLLHIIEREPKKNRKEELLSSIDKYLPKVHGKLLDNWNGAIQAYDSNNSDRKRHFMCSIRELFTHLLQILAPEDDIIKWICDPSYFHEGKPTRKARIEYICRNIKGKRFVEFKKNEIKAVLTFINILQEGTHSLESEFTAADLVVIKSKAEASLKFLLEIEFEINR